MKRKEFIKKAGALGALLLTGGSFASSALANHKMENTKQILFKTRGHRADIGEIKIIRLLSNRHVDHVGHFVFLDYIPPFLHKQPKKPDPRAAHPHRGIATLTYILNGEVDHYDSRGHKGTVASGGVQWMKAGNGIVHNEALGPDPMQAEKANSGFQFWINLPASQKKEAPDYMAIQSAELPLIPLQENAATLKVVLGAYAGHASKIPTYAKQFLYHLKIAPGKTLRLPAEEGLEYALCILEQDLGVNGEMGKAGELLGFDTKAGSIVLQNPHTTEAECIVFGGEKYLEPYVAYGPFVMNTEEEIRQAYQDYQQGKYGKMNYN